MEQPSAAASWERFPFLHDGEGTDTDVLPRAHFRWGARGRRNVIAGSVTLGLVCLATATVLVWPKSESDRARAKLKRAEILAELKPADLRGLDDPKGVLAKANELVNQVKGLKTTMDAHKDTAGELKDTSISEMKHGSAKLRFAREQFAAAEANASEAREMRQKAAEIQKQANALFDESRQRTDKAKAAKHAGQELLGSSKARNKSVDALGAKIKHEAKSVLAVQNKEIDALLREATYMEQRASADREFAEAAMKKANGTMNAAQGKIKHARHVIAASRKNVSEEKARMAKDKVNISRNQVVEKQAAETKNTGQSEVNAGREEITRGRSSENDAKDALRGVGKEMSLVSQMEGKAMHASASHRTCVDLPGVRLHEIGEPSDFAPLAAEKDVSSSQKCSTWCQQHEGCVQAIFAEGSEGCRLFERATADVHEVAEGYVSSICGGSKDKKRLLEIAQKAKSQIPVIPNATECAWAGENCGETKCCRDVGCSWDFKTCKPFSCYKSAAGDAQCKETAKWNKGTIIGGGRPARKIKAAKGQLLQGTSLFCFMVVNWKGSEGAIADNIKQKKQGIYECDAHAILSGWETPKTSWSTYINAEAFVKHWHQLQNEKIYMQHDWTVKVDADTVFFPRILKMHLAAMKTPLGSRVYVKNINYKFQFLGAIEVLSRGAVELYFKEENECSKRLLKSHPKAGEDFYMKACLDAIGVDSVEDFKLLRDSTCGVDCPGSIGPCNDGWVVAYHSFSDVLSWNTCHNQASGAQPAESEKKTAVTPEEEIVPAATGQEAATAVNYLKEALGLKVKLQPDAVTARTMNVSAWAQIREGREKVRHGQSVVQTARNITKVAKAREREATRDIQAAQAAAAAFSKTEQAAQVRREQGLKALAAGKAAAKAARGTESRSDLEGSVAADAESHGLEEVRGQRVCANLPGVRMKDGNPVDLPAIVGKADTTTAEKCSEWCRAHRTCRMAVYSAGAKGCYLFDTPTDMPVAFADTHNSTFCGEWEEKDAMVAKVQKIFKMKPYVPPIRQCSWAGENCMQTKCCANEPMPNWKFTEFQWYTCYKRDAQFAGCHLGAAPADWDGTKLGGMGTREVPKAPEGVLVQGTSLFCFAVVKWDRPAIHPFWDSEATLANNIKKTGRSIYECDDHAFFNGGELNGGGDGSSINNIDAFIGAWSQVRDDGRYLKHDWTVKVDSDAIFFPARLKRHLFDLRTPQGSRVYLKNINFKFHFLGALEVFTREALQLYFQRLPVCAQKVGHEGGEDYYMKACMDGLGIDHQTDFKLLNDKYAATGNCNDPWVVAFHFYKQVTHWNGCWQAAVNAEKNSNMHFKKLQ